MIRRAAAADAVIVALIFVVGFAAGVATVRSFRAHGGVQDFWQIEFGPAVMLACGHGYRNAAVAQLPELLAFLQLKQDRFACANLPNRVPTHPELGHFHRTSRYLESTIALVWRMTGPSWSALVWYGGMLYGSVVALVYALTRVVLGRALSLTVTAAVFVSALNLAMLPHYRDYAKAPFILAMILVMARLVCGRPQSARVIALSAAGGALAAVGLGFRNDLLITVPPFIVTMLLFTPWDMPSLWRTRLLAVGAAALAFVVVGFPVIRDYARGSNTPHVMLLGLGTPFDERLGVRRSVYEFGSYYYDYWATTTIDSYARRIEGRPDGVLLGTPEYDRSSAAYLKEIAVRFPGDLWTRAVAALRRIPGFFLREYQVAPAWMESRWLHRFYYARARVSAALPAAVTVILIALLALCAAHSLRYALFAAMLLVVFMGGAAIQFNERHFFHLEFVSWGALAFAIYAMVHVARRDWDLRLSPTRGMAFALIAAAAAGTTFWLTRAYQHREVRALLQSYLHAPSVGMGGEAQTSTHTSASLQTQFLKIEVDRRRCEGAEPALTVRYAPGLPNDFTRTIALPRAAAEQPTTTFVQVYSRGNEVRFAGIEFAEALRPCVTQVVEIATVAALPLLLDVTLPADWEQRPLHQTLATWW